MYKCTPLQKNSHRRLFNVPIHVYFMQLYRVGTVKISSIGLIQICFHSLGLHAYVCIYIALVTTSLATNRAEMKGKWTRQQL